MWDQLEAREAIHLADSGEMKDIISHVEIDVIQKL